MLEQRLKDKKEVSLSVSSTLPSSQESPSMALCSGLLPPETQRYVAWNLLMML